MYVEQQAQKAAQASQQPQPDSNGNVTIKTT
jgi:hypothetical protein